ncbi:hypothetical protein BJ508DRAFT_313101 [Ascobolus immersus RN42]|uniref:Uncharacterized protein n=1 Tax=Ascobolus immersus RN42 TaxID=1160509 RepID=A0A3N4HJZ1_ASCIM|nr:hypothetical protein BJ508DRAFT_313101 [Ascobolus immersus RN42]
MCCVFLLLCSSAHKQRNQRQTSKHPHEHPSPNSPPNHPAQYPPPAMHDIRLGFLPPYISLPDNITISLVGKVAIERKYGLSLGPFDVIDGSSTLVKLHAGGLGGIRAKTIIGDYYIAPADIDVEDPDDDGEAMEELEGLVEEGLELWGVATWTEHREHGLIARVEEIVVFDAVIENGRLVPAGGDLRPPIRPNMGFLQLPTRQPRAPPRALQPRNLNNLSSLQTINPIRKQPIRDYYPRQPQFGTGVVSFIFHPANPFAAPPPYNVFDKPPTAGEHVLFAIHFDPTSPYFLVYMVGDSLDSEVYLGIRGWVTGTIDAEIVLAATVSGANLGGTVIESHPGRMDDGRYVWSGLATFADMNGSADTHDNGAETANGGAGGEDAVSHSSGQGAEGFDTSSEGSNAEEEEEEEEREEDDDVEVMGIGRAEYWADDNSEDEPSGDDDDDVPMEDQEDVEEQRRRFRAAMDGLDDLFSEED